MEINVNQTDDMFYRYKMPKLLAKVEGKGNGIKTVIVNMSDIARKIFRKPSYPTKYFGFELGAQIKLDEKNDRYIVNGSHEASRLQELMFGFIKKFVLCQSCDNPETSLLIKKPFVYYKCSACGHIDQIDPKHRLTSFIIKNPPETECEGAYVNQESNACKEESYVDQVGWVGDSNLALDEFTRKEDEKLDMDKSLSVEFRTFVEELFNTRQILLKRADVEEKAKACKIGPDFIVIIMDIVFCNRDTIIDDVERYKPLFVYYTRQGYNTEEMQSLLLEEMEKLINSFNIVSKSCHFLKALYDNDIVEEEAILAWYKKDSISSCVSADISREIKDQCHKMIDWLEEADEESDEEN